MEVGAERPRSYYERLVDRYIDVTTWPTSKKVALVMLTAIPFQGAAWALVTFHGGALAGILNLPYLKMLTGAFVAIVLLLFLIAFPFARRGREARWTIYLVITWVLVREDIPCEERGEIDVKGLHYPVRIYEVAEPSTLST